MLVLHRFRVAELDAPAFRSELEEAVAALSERPGFLQGALGRNVDDPGLWVLETRWSGAGDYRRALSSYDVKVRAWGVLARAIDEPSAYEVLDPGESANEPRPREN